MRLLIGGLPALLALHEAVGQPAGPTFLVQPGMVTSHFVSAPPGTAASTGFNIRFATLIPTRWRGVTVLAGASLTPHGLGGAGQADANAPVIFVGNLFPLFSRDATGGWVSADLPVLISHSRGGGRERNPRPFGQDLTIEFAFTAHVGTRLLSSFGGVLGQLRAYAILNQNLTPNREANGDTNRVDPTAYYGITVPIGGIRQGR